MAYVVNTQVLVRRYRAGICSGAWCFCAVTTIATVFLPLFFGIASGGFWTREVLRFEQPDLRYDNDVLLIATGERLDDAGVVQSLALAYSTAARSRELLVSSLRAPSVMRAAQVDLWGDSRVDEVQLNVSLPLAASERITAVSLILPVRFRLHDTVRLDTRGALVLSHAAGQGGSGAVFVGDAALRMRMQLPAGTRYLDPAGGSAVLDMASATSPSQLSVASVLRASAGRNITLDAEVPAPVWVPDGGYRLLSPAATPGTAAGGFPGIGDGARTFDVEVRLRIAPQPIWMRPTLGETLKLAWMQYLAILVPSAALFWALACLVFDSGIVDAAADADRVVKAKLH